MTWLKGILIICLAFLLVTGFYRIYNFLVSSSLFSVKEVQVKGNSFLSSEEILAKSGVEKGENIFDLDLERVAKSLSGNPLIEKVKVSRKLPNRIYISVFEKKPVALLNSGQLYLIDKEGELLPSIGGNNGNLPSLEGFKQNSYGIAVEFLDEIDEYAPALLSEISRISSSEGILLHLRNGIKVKVGKDELKRQVIFLKAVLDKINEKNFNPDYIDLRFGRQVFVKLN